MNTQEKAKELVSKFNFEHLGDRYILHQTVEESKRCGLIAVEEIMNILPPTYNDYWEQVKHEINNL